MAQLPYRCPKCSSREPPNYTTRELGTEEINGDRIAVAVSCTECGTVWGATVIMTAVDAWHLVEDNMWIAEDVISPGEDLEQARIRLEVEEFPSYQRYRDDPDVIVKAPCPHCGDDVFPTTGFIPPVGEDRILSVTAQYCPGCEAVLDVTWG